MSCCSRVNTAADSHQKCISAVECFEECFELLKVRNLISHLNSCSIPPHYLMWRGKKGDYQGSQAL